ncbi:MAG: dTMP kinase [Methanomassiliicoccales archaeon]|nr:dTMP kinase [Methanomassiliicoccales archaeon]
MSPNTKKKGAFIVLEGIDGTGKSTLSKKLADWMQEMGREVVLTAEPTKDWLGLAVRRANEEELDPLTESLLFTADRCEHTRQIVQWVAQGKVVVCDRYFGSTVAYQGAALQESMKEEALPWLVLINSPVIRKPHMTVLLTSDAELAMKRVGDRGALSKFERGDYLQRVQQNYLELAERFDWRVVDSNGPLPEVFEQLKKVLQAYV